MCLLHDRVLRGTFDLFTNCLQFGHTVFTTDLYNVLKDKGKEIYKNERSYNKQ